MRLEQEVRKALFAGKRAELTFGGRCPVRRDGVYTIHNENGTLQGHFRVIQTKQTDEGVKALVILHGDEIRLLDRGGDGYTDFDGRAMPRGDEPGAELEAIREDCGRLNNTGACCQKHISQKAGDELAERRAAQKRRQRVEDVERKAQSVGMSVSITDETTDDELRQLQILVEHRKAA